MAVQVVPAANMLYRSLQCGVPCEPVRHWLGGSIDAAYQVQVANLQRRLGDGQRLVGRKIGLTTRAAQKAFNATAPNQGFLLSNMMYRSGDWIPMQGLIEPLAEVELAFRVAATVESLPFPADFQALLAEIAPAIEIVDSRIKAWDVDLMDMIADNGSAGAFVIGQFRPTTTVRFSGLSGTAFRQVGQDLAVQVLTDQAIEDGAEAAYWLAGKAIELGIPLQKGEIILSGSLVPPVRIQDGDNVQAGIEMLGSVDFTLRSSAGSI